MRKSDARRQRRDHWCGPATIQMIDGADDRGFNSQRSWARELGTVQAGTSIGQMKRAMNRKTRWFNVSVVSVANWGTSRFYRAVSSRIGYLQAPFIQHPTLDEDLHPYLSADGHNYGGHLQAGRGFTKRGKKRKLHLLEPFNEPDWTSYTAKTSGPRKISMKSALRANKQNRSFKNIAY
ncbi:MAG: hypothetical protein ACRDO7_03810 [Nocardioidaceae bacterium]